MATDHLHYYNGKGLTFPLCTIVLKFESMDWKKMKELGEAVI